MSPNTLNDIKVAIRTQLEATLAKAKDEFDANQDTAHRIVLYNAAHELSQFVIGMIGEHIAVYDFTRKATRETLRRAAQEMNDDKLIFTLNSTIPLLKLCFSSYDEDHDIHRCLRALDINGFHLTELNIAFSDINRKRDEMGALLRALEKSLSTKP